MPDCSISDTDYSDSCTTLRIATPVAKKKHICGECHQIIPKGKKYEYYVCVFNGYFHTAKTCSTCVSLRDAFFPCGGYIFEHVRDYIAEQIYSLRGEVSYECILPLTTEAKNFVFDKIEKIWCDENESKLPYLV